MYTLLTILCVVAAVLLVLLVLVQNSKGGGLAAGFNSGNQVMGVRKTTDFLEKSTWVLISAIVLMSIFAVGLKKTSKTTNPVDKMENVENQEPRAEENGEPGFGESGTDSVGE